MLGVCGPIHVVLEPHLEAIGVDGCLLVSSERLALEVIAAGQLQHGIGLLTHQ